jgi:anti-anti-sigma regulatory factor
MTIKLLDEQGPVITGRSAATRIRERIEADIRSGDDVVVDFDGVLTISPSAGDELFAKLRTTNDAGGHVRFVNMPEAVEALARYVIANREHDAVS